MPPEEKTETDENSTTGNKDSERKKKKSKDPNVINWTWLFLAFLLANLIMKLAMLFNKDSN